MFESRTAHLLPFAGLSRDGWAARVRLPSYDRADMVIDPRRAFGLPLVVHGGARVEDLVDRFVAGDTVAAIADNFAVSQEESKT